MYDADKLYDFKYFVCIISKQEDFSNDHSTSYGNRQ